MSKSFLIQIPILNIEGNSIALLVIRKVIIMNTSLILCVVTSAFEYLVSPNIPIISSSCKSKIESIFSHPSRRASGLLP